MGFPRQEYFSGLPFPSPGDHPNPGIKPRSLALQLNSYRAHQEMQQIRKLNRRLEMMIRDLTLGDLPGGPEVNALDFHYGDGSQGLIPDWDRRCHKSHGAAKKKRFKT